jgi:hypothetical protein
MAAVTIRIGPADHGRALSSEEFRAAEEEEGCCYELAEGENLNGRVADLWMGVNQDDPE